MAKKPEDPSRRPVAALSAEDAKNYIHQMLEEYTRQGVEHWARCVNEANQHLASDVSINWDGVVTLTLVKPGYPDVQIPITFKGGSYAKGQGPNQN